MAVNVAVFLFIRIVNALSELFLHPVLGMDTIMKTVALPASVETVVFRPWTLITYMFIHWDFFHLLSNMIWLYWFGKIMMEYLGTRRVVATYFLGGLAGALIYILAFNLIPFFGSQVNQAVAMGASASAMAIMVATATLLPDYQLGVLFLGPVRLKWIALVVILLDLINVNGSNAGGHIAHLGGAAFGYVFIRLLRKGTDLSAFWGKGSSRLRVVSRSAKSSDDIYRKEKLDREERLNSILDKINRSGYGSLTSEERDFLYSVSKD